MTFAALGLHPDLLKGLKDLGFTHFISYGADYGRIWDEKKAVPPAKPEEIAKNRTMLDEALKNGLEVVTSLSPSRVLESDVDIPAEITAKWGVD